MVTIRTLANDFIAGFKQTNPEKEVSFAQAVFWILTIGDQLKSQHIDKTNSKSFVHIFPEVPIESETVAAKDDVPGRKFITLPATIYNFYNDNGIDYIAYGHDSDVCGRPGYTFNTFTRTTPSEAKRLYMRRRENPSVEQPYFLPVGDGKVYVLGLEESDIDTLEVGLFTSFDPLTSVDVDAPFDFPEHLKQILIRQLYDLGRFVMLIPNDFRLNAVPENSNPDLSTQKLISVNNEYMQPE